MIKCACGFAECPQYISVYAPGACLVFRGINGTDSILLSRETARALMGELEQFVQWEEGRPNPSEQAPG